MLCRGQVDDQVAAGAEQAEELPAQGGSERDAEFPAERGDDVAAAVCPGGKTEAGIIMSCGACHSASDHVSRGQAGWRTASRDGRGPRLCMAGARCIILRSADIAVRNTPAAGRCMRAVVTSEGIGGTGGFVGSPPQTGTLARQLRSGTGIVSRDAAVRAS